MITSSVASKVAKLALAVGGIGSAGSVGSLVSSVGGGSSVVAGYPLEIGRFREKLGKGKVRFDWTTGWDSQSNRCWVTRLDWTFFTGEEIARKVLGSGVWLSSGPYLKGAEDKINNHRFTKLNNAIKKYIDGISGEMKEVTSEQKKSRCLNPVNFAGLMNTAMKVAGNLKDNAGNGTLECKKNNELCGNDNVKQGAKELRDALNLFIGGVGINGKSPSNVEELVHLYLFK